MAAAAVAAAANVLLRTYPAARPSRAAQDARGKQRELLAARSLQARTFA